MEQKQKREREREKKRPLTVKVTTKRGKGERERIMGRHCSPTGGWRLESPTEKVPFLLSGNSRPFSSPSLGRRRCGRVPPKIMRTRFWGKKERGEEGRKSGGGPNPPLPLFSSSPPPSSSKGLCCFRGLHEVRRGAGTTAPLARILDRLPSLPPPLSFPHHPP